MKNRTMVDFNIENEQLDRACKLILRLGFKHVGSDDPTEQRDQVIQRLQDNTGISERRIYPLISDNPVRNEDMVLYVDLGEQRNWPTFTELFERYQRDLEDLERYVLAEADLKTGDPEREARAISSSI